MFVKKFITVTTLVVFSFVLFSCGSASNSRTSNVKKVLESRANAVASGESFEAPQINGSEIVSNQSSLKKQAPAKPVMLKVDLDLTNLTSVVADANLRELQNNKEKYKGIIVKAKGEYQHYQNPTTGNDYYNCIFASSCCPNGLEFILTDTSKYPKNNGDIITVVGSFNYYDEDGIIYYNLVDATIV